MNKLFFELFLLFFNWQNLSDVAKNNTLKNETNSFFYSKKYISAEKNLKKLTKEVENEPEILGNLGLTLFQQKKYKEAKTVFGKLTNSTNIQVALAAEFHLGLINSFEKDTMKAIANFENALRIDYKHDIARYNLVLLKKLYNPKLNKPKTKQDQNKIDIEKNKTKKSILDPLSEREELLERLNKINLTESQIKSIFENLSNTEIKYIQQKKIKSQNNKGNYQSW